MKLITFGCSWTKGIGITYEKGMSEEEFKKGGLFRKSQFLDQYSFRGILSKRLGFENINHASGGSSNQRQERLATEYFNNHSTEDTVVLWGITSITRNELTINGIRKNFHYGNDLDEYQRYYVDHFYDEETEIERLGNAMIHWNQFFEGHNIPNLWFQTFNSYQFPQKIDRLLPRDLLTNLTHPAIRDHHSSEVDGNNKTHKGTDSQRIKEAARKGFVNPYSLHPTKETHLKIADMLETPLREIL